MSRRWKRGLIAVLVTVVAGLAYFFWVAESESQHGFSAIGRSASGLLEYRQNQTGIIFVRLPGGTFLQGSAGEEAESIETAHETTLSPFLIAKYEVSQREWEELMGSNPSHFKGPDLPVESVSWEDCIEFCSKYGLALPTEAQWEYACRGGTTTEYWSGEELTAAEAHFGDQEGTVAVHSLPPNPYGLYHVAGNVGEWCLDHFSEEFYETEGARRLDPVCRVSESRTRCVRGGVWNYPVQTGRSASRAGSEPDYRSDETGLRPVYNLLD